MLQLQEESIPSLDEANTQEIPTIEITPDAEENAAEIVEENQADQSELISSKKNKKMKFGKVLKGKMKVAKMKGKAKKGSTGNESESVADDLVIESSKVINEEDISERDGKSIDEPVPLEDDIAETNEAEEDAGESKTKSEKAKKKFKNKFSMLGNKLKSKGKSKMKGKKKTADKDALVEAEEEEADGDKGEEEDEEKVEVEEDEDVGAKQIDSEDEAEEELDEEEPSLKDEQEVATPEKTPDSPMGTKIKTVSSGQTLETSPVSPTDSSKFENAREARRQARRKLLEKMEDEGKLTKDDSRVTVITPEPSKKVETVESHTEDIPKRRNRRRKRDLPDPESQETPEESLAPLSPTPGSPTPDVSAAEANMVPSPREKKKKRRKKKAKQGLETEVDGGAVLSEKDEDVIISNKAVLSAEAEEPQTPEKQKTSTLRKLMPNKKSKGGPSPKNAEKEPIATVLSSPAIRQLDSAMSVKVHYADHLYPTLYLLHPLVRIHVLDSKTGKPLPSTLGDARYSTIQPLLTEPFDLRINKTMSPCWEEQLLIPEHYNSIIGNDNAMLFLEIVDIVPARALKKHKTGWNLIAWAFLKLKSGQGGHNVNRKLRLQLFRYPIIEQSISDIFLGLSRTKYPSTMYVTVGNITDKSVLSSLYVDQVAAQNPALSQYIEQVVQESTSPNEQVATKVQKPTWSRAPGQMCKIPKTEHFEIPTPEMGCLLMCFSNDGRWLACGCVGKDSHPILVYSIPDGIHQYTLTGHYNIVYDLKWYKHSLLSASSDCTARVWKNGQQAKQMAHPCFVYSAKWVDKRKVITGSYDRTLRIWDTNCAGENCALLAQLHGHTGHINSIVFKGNDTLYSGDSKGQIIEWNGGGSAWSQSETVQPPELKDVPISVLLLHPNKRRMFVQSRDSHVRLVDLRIRAVTQRYTGHTNTREYIRCSVSPCGTYLLSASEDGNVFVWLVETGELSYTYKLGLPHSTSDVKFHPHDNFVAISAFGSSLSVQFYNRQDTVQELANVPGAGMKMEVIKEKLLTVSPSKGSLNAALAETRNKLKLPGDKSGLVQSTPINPGMSITLTPGIAQISGLPRDNFIKLRVLHDYAAQRSDEIGLRAGEFVKLVYMDTDGWWVGENKAGQQGYFPANHVDQPTPAQSLPFKSLNNSTLQQTASTPRARRKIDFNMSLTNGEKEWQTFDSTMHVQTTRSPGNLSPRMSDNESLASSTRSASRRRHTSAKVGAGSDREG
ncbi:jouberin-like [Bolinopsis microptera]|uniref:jouberin-like n=1 Tax=Bolinopsis microptera TaxID=2820187 RepID=UPI0030793A45